MTEEQRLAARYEEEASKAGMVVQTYEFGAGPLGIKMAGERSEGMEVCSISIKAVAPNSAAERKGVTPGSELVMVG